MKLAAWNVEGRLGTVSDRGRGAPQAIVDGILACDADVLFLPEAYGREVAEGIDAQLTRRGYRLFDVSYQDEGKPNTPSDENPHNRFLSRLPVIKHEVLRFGDARTLQAIYVIDPVTNRPVCIIGIHFDDRLESRRLRQVEDVVTYSRRQSMPVVLMGDFNALYGWKRTSILLRMGAVLQIGRLCGTLFIGTALVRIAGMAQGTTLGRIHDALDVYAANERHIGTTTPKMRQASWLPSVRLLEIDHMLISRELVSSSFRVAADGGSDHRLISATIKMSDGLLVAK